jgi:iron complex transport system substrate-binding protein
MAVALWLLLATQIGALAADTLPRVASTDMCSDVLLLKLAAPEQVVSVSAAGQNPRMSPVADAASRYPANRGGVEDLLYLKPDVALVYLGWMGRKHSELLGRVGVRVVQVPYPGGWNDALATTRAIAAEIGRAEFGEALARNAEDRMRAVAQTPRPYRVLYLRPNGGTAGANTYVDDVIRMLGLRNLAAEQGISGWGGFPLELLVERPPDLFLLGYFDEAQPVNKSAYARHALLREMLERVPSIAVPTTYWGCGGIELVDAAEVIAARIAALPSPSLSPRGD